MNLNFFDIACAVLLILAAIRGFFKGFLHEVLSLVGCFVALWLSLTFSDDVAPFLIEKLSLSVGYSNAIAFVVIFVLVIILVRLLSFGLTKLASALLLGFVNRLLGLLFGVCKMALFLSILLNLISYLDNKESYVSHQFKEESTCYRPIESIVPKTMSVLGLEEFFER
ncbi:MAG: CvpA family protein [Mangrovibacterium sp.]